jgi:hypothetical protein
MYPSQKITDIFKFISKNSKYSQITNNYVTSQEYLKEAAEGALGKQVICFPESGIDEHKFEIFLGCFKFKDDVCLEKLTKIYGLFCCLFE